MHTVSLFIQLQTNGNTHIILFIFLQNLSHGYSKCPKISNTKVNKMTYANSADPDQTADQGLQFAIPLF